VEYVQKGEGSKLDKIDLNGKSPTDGVVAAPLKARFGAYSTAEMKKFVGWALKQPDNW
jgi:hypothetical protein